MRTRTYPYDYKRHIAPLTKVEQEKELHLFGANCPICGLLGMKIDMLPGTGVLCDIHGIVPLEDARAEAAYDDVADARMCARFRCGL